jgi:hypothetical protein
VWEKTYSGLEETMNKSEEVEQRGKGMNLSCIYSKG